jgi:hypothetical protein
MRKELFMDRPKVLKNIDLKGLIAECEGYFDEVDAGYVDDDTEHFIFEATMKTLYGVDVFRYEDGKIN